MPYFVLRMAVVYARWRKSPRGRDRTGRLAEDDVEAESEECVDAEEEGDVDVVVADYERIDEKRRHDGHEGPLTRPEKTA
jgi:hypothetical protein